MTEKSRTFWLSVTTYGIRTHAFFSETQVYPKVLKPWSFALLIGTILQSSGRFGCSMFVRRWTRHSHCVLFGSCIERIGFHFLNVIAFSTSHVVSAIFPHAALKCSSRITQPHEQHEDQNLTYSKTIVYRHEYAVACVHTCASLAQVGTPSHVLQ